MDLSLEQKININNSIKELCKKQKECGKIGHISNSEWFNYYSGKISGLCEKCGEMYERNPTPEEQEKYLTRLREPYTIQKN